MAGAGTDDPARAFFQHQLRCHSAIATMKSLARALWVAASAAFVVALASGAAVAASHDAVARGKYIFGAAGGCGCHTEKDRQVNSGGRKYDGPFGTVYSTNITP